MLKKCWRVRVASAIFLATAAAMARAQGIMRPPVPLGLQPVESSFEVSGKYTAQRRPRVAVLNFEDTNAGAGEARYGDSVEAMLVTFLKRKSQFVVVERARLKDVLEERQRMEHGMVHLDPDDPSARELLEKIDAFILGSVTLLDVVEVAETAKKHDSGPTPAPESAAAGGSETSSEPLREQIRGPRIEIDAKLISRFDGRIIAAAQRRGPVACLRSIVERLGVAIEQEFLRPYYGSLKVDLSNPEYVRIFLTPILLDTALDEEKPPVERGSTVRIGSEQDIVHTWVMDPTSYTIENLLSGWYTMRLGRPGYDSVSSDNANWQARVRFGQVELYDHRTGTPFEQVDRDLRRFVVHVEPQKIKTVDADDLKFGFRKRGGSLAPLVMREFVDSDFVHRPQRVVLMSKKLDINDFGQPDEYADDRKCDLFDETPLKPPPYGRTYIAAGKKLDYDAFKGGELVIEDYQGEIVPPGDYTMTLWEPYYERQEKIAVTIHPQDRDKETKTVLPRKTLPLELVATGPRPEYRLRLQGRDTHKELDLTLDFSTPQERPGMPVDFYTASTDIPGLSAWRHTAELLPAVPSPPAFDPSSKVNDPQLFPESAPQRGPLPPLAIKTRFTLAGHLDVFSKSPDPLAADLFFDREVGETLDRLLYGLEPPPEPKRGFLGTLFRRGGHKSQAAPTAQDPGKVDPQRTAPSRDTDRLRTLLAQHLEMIDLLVLDPRDMVRLRRSPEVADIVRRYVAAGGALFAFISAAGDYESAVGAPLSIEKMGRRTRRFQLAPGDVRGIVPTFEKKRVKVKSKRSLPELSAVEGPWRAVAFTQGKKEPRIIERGTRGEGGYVALWLDDPESFRGILGGTVQAVEETRANVEDRVLRWARFLMYRRYDPTSEQRRQAEEALTR
jgi:curli production assembly/transport component CsgG